MTFERAVELFYNNEKIQEQFNYWDIDYAIATIRTFIDDVENLTKEEVSEEE